MSDLLDRLSNLMKRYTTEYLAGVKPDAFEQHLRSLLGKVDPSVEGYGDIGVQRDLSIKFAWGHDHNFGSFKLRGNQRNRHVRLFYDYLTLFDLNLADISHKNVFDVGVWTGGTSLLLAALGNRVMAIEEVVKYAKAAQYLAKSFGIQDKLKVVAKSLYECDFHNHFDLVHLSGVVYHLTDPIVGLRIAFNSLKLKGKCLVESACVKSDKSLCLYEGCSRFHGGTKKNLSRGGWNWFKPSPSALKLMMENVGFENVRTKTRAHRLFAIGNKRRRKDIVRAGLSRPNIK